MIFALKVELKSCDFHERQAEIRNFLYEFL
jgi:hypothetical protein